MATYALIPGAGGDAWEWHLVASELEARGQVAVPVSLPTGDDGAGWNEYADAVVAAIGDRSDVVLVAQSLAGFTAPLVCARRPVDLIVLLNAMIPLPGETGNDWWGNVGSGEAQRAYLASIGITGTDAQDDRVIYFHDVPDAVVEEAYSRGEPQQSMTPDGPALCARRPGPTSRPGCSPAATIASSRPTSSAASRASASGSRPT